VVRHHVHGLRVRAGLAHGQSGGIWRIRSSGNLQVHPEENAAANDAGPVDASYVDACNSDAGAAVIGSAKHSAAHQHHAAGFATSISSPAEKAVAWASFLGL
jgi:hypothetical protein